MQLRAITRKLTRTSRKHWRGQRLALLRVRPGTPRYESVLRLRYEGFVESGFIDPRVSDQSVMRLARDRDSVIIGMFRGERILAIVRVGLGFDFSVGDRFIDTSLNGMASRVGYLYLPDATRNAKVPRFIRDMYAEILAMSSSAAVSWRSTGC
jgi:hypothetical protein